MSLQQRRPLPFITSTCCSHLLSLKPPRHPIQPTNKDHSVTTFKVHHDATEPLVGEVGARLGTWEVSESGGKLFKNGSKIRLQIRRSANDRLNCKDNAESK